MSSPDFSLPPHMRRRYHYLVFPVHEIAPLLKPPDPSQPDAYITSEPLTDALRDALAKGYRWVRTDGDYAVFEKVSLWLPGAATEERKDND